jgi:hypothetical protein
VEQVLVERSTEKQVAEAQEVVRISTQVVLHGFGTDSRSSQHRDRYERIFMSQEEGKTPKVFVSHASEDKARFVLGFATKLLENGIDAWLDKWEMHPGDSLVDKIFEVGIGGAEAILIILSRNSVEKPWVREELNASVVERIKRGTKIIPIVLDDCVVPIALQSTVYVRIADPAHYDAELSSIVSAIYEHSEKPPLGSPPTYIQTPLERISGLKRIDSLLLKLVGEKAIEDCQHRMLTAEILSQATTLGVSRHDFYESLAVLGDKGYFELQRSSAQEPSELELRSLTRGGIAKFSTPSRLLCTGKGFSRGRFERIIQA